jgi:uncharacterized membrane protein YidH (DUF202 family)
MSRPTGKSLKQARTDRSQPLERVPYATYLVRKILGWSRLKRIALISLFAVALTAAVFPLIDEIYITHFFDESTRILPSFISVSIGIIMYGVGWWLLVGTRGERQPERISVFIYVLIGILVIIFVLFLLINGYHIATLPDA